MISLQTKSFQYPIEIFTEVFLQVYFLLTYCIIFICYTMLYLMLYLQTKFLQYSIEVYGLHYSSYFRCISQLISAKCCTNYTRFASLSNCCEGIGKLSLLEASEFGLMGVSEVWGVCVFQREAVSRIALGVASAEQKTRKTFVHIFCMATNKIKLPAENCDKRSLWSYVRLSVRLSVCLYVMDPSPQSVVLQFDHVVDHVCWRGAFGPHCVATKR